MCAANERWCAHSAIAFALFLGTGVFLVAGWLPPVRPAMDAVALHDLFLRDRLRIRLGTSMLALGSVFWWSFSAAIAARMRAAEGGDAILSRLFMALAAGTTIVIMLASYLWLAAAYRPSIAPETLQAFNDLAWLMFIGAYPPASFQAAILARVILTDQSQRPTYPRWAGFLNIWVATLFLPGVLLPFFTSGPFAWNGLIGFWLVAFVFFSWIIVMWRLTLAAITAAEGKAAGS